ncbi:receptor protein-tyrosine kinase [Desulfomarina profundi]|uniref:Receptor protein-tyrosine kinase n=1 Tax=Desulfomarina profundi TaxID=2772557 RepID=A0A8D5JN53_9BACT|nr:hypothetical protein [Desulfomarina profundi]BCL62317.1 receptor protein-tyrosine kinase [Desulfomarina profundi]
MANPWESDNCDEIRAYYSAYYIPQAAALWCGVPVEVLKQILSQATETSRNIYAHPKISCLEPRCRAIHDAIDNNKLACGRDGKSPVFDSEDHVAPERRTVSRQDLKEWIVKEFPSNKPEFLFDEVERKTHSAINAESFRALQVDRDALQRQLQSAKESIKMMELQKYEVAAKLKQYEERLKCLDNAINPRSEKTYLNIIGALLEVVTGTFKGETFTSETQLRDFIEEKFDDLRGVRSRTTARIFAAAKRALNDDMA